MAPSVKSLGKSLEDIESFGDREARLSEISEQKAGSEGCGLCVSMSRVSSSPHTSAELNSLASSERPQWAANGFVRSDSVLSVLSGSDDSMSSASRGGSVVCRYGAEVRAALDRVRKLTDPEALCNPPADAASRPVTPRTSVGIQLAGTKVRGIIPCGPAALSQGIFVGDELVRVNNAEVSVQNVAALLAGVDRPGSVVHVQVRSGKTGSLIDVELERADAEDVKLLRTLSDWLALIRDGAEGSSKTAGAVDQVMALLTSLQLRRKELEGDHKERAQAMADMVRVSLDDIYLTVGKMEGAYKSVHKRARKLLHEVERANLGASRGQGALQRSSADHLDAGGLASGDSYDLRALISAQAKKIGYLKGMYDFAQAKEIEYLKGMGSLGSQASACSGSVPALAQAKQGARLDSAAGADMNPSVGPSTPTSSVGNRGSHPNDLDYGGMDIGGFAANAGSLVHKLMQLEHENRQLRQDLSLLSPVAGTQTGYEDPKLMTGIAASSVSDVHNVMLREEKGPYKYQMQPDAANDFASEQHQAFISEQRADFATPPLYDLDRTAVTGKTHGIADEPKQVLGGGFVQEMAM